MEGSSSLILWISVGACITLMSILVIIALVRLKLRKKSKQHIEKENVTLKNQLEFKGIPIPVQVRLESSDLESYTSDHDKRFDLKRLTELRRGEIDPLLGVLYNNQLRKAQSEGNVNTLQDYSSQEFSANEGRQPFAGAGSPTSEDLYLKKIESKECILDVLRANLALVWASSDQSLSIIILDLQRLPHKSSTSTILVNVNLEVPTLRSEDVFHAKRELNRERSAAFTFQGLRLYDIEKSKLWVTLLEKKTTLSREATVAKGSVSLSNMVLVPNKPLSLSVNLEFMESYVASHSFQKKYGNVILSLKCIFVGPFYDRFTIDIKKAENLLHQKPGATFKAELFILNSTDRLHYFHTPFQKGPSPEWNSSFSFDICLDDVDDLSLEVTVMKLSRVNGTSKVGKGVLSASVGTSSWREAINKCGEVVILRQPLHSPHLEVGSWSVNEKRMGLLLVSVESAHTRKNSKPKIKFVVKTIAHFEHNKSGGSYKMEIIVQKNEVTLQNFVTGIATSTDLIWNAPFAFDVVEDEIDDYKINLTLIRIGRTRRSSKIGWTQIAKESHCVLRECLKPPRKIIDNWHYILSS